MVQYTAVPQKDGAPLRAITVRDAIGDLPPIMNGADKAEMDYSGASALAVTCATMQCAARAAGVRAPC